MVPHAHNDMILIILLQDSLVGELLSLYANLKKDYIRSWKDLAESFVKQYKYKISLAHDQMQLWSVEKKDDETSKNMLNIGEKLLPKLNLHF